MTQRTLLHALAGLALAIVALATLLAFLDLQVVTLLSRLLLVAVALLGLVGLAWRGLHTFLWKVGRRLAFSYFLLGALPIPLMSLLLCVFGYLLSGFFMGHLCRQALGEVREDLAVTARQRLEAFIASGRPGSGTDGAVSLAYYVGGRRKPGADWAPAAWPEWVPLAEAPETGATPLVDRGEGPPTLALGALSDDGDRGVLAVWTGDLDAELRQGTDMWIETHHPAEAEPGGDPGPSLKLTVGELEMPVRALGEERRTPEAEAFFAERAPHGDLFDRPWLWWGEIGGPLRRLEDGSPVAEYSVFTLNATPRLIAGKLFARGTEVDAAAWAVLFGVAGLLFWIYFAAALMAIFLIVGLSRAVNRLSRATAQVRRGDFSARIPVRRRDQIGELQRHFNQMAANLEQLVATATQKEVLEKELAIARDLQRSLLPQDLPAAERVEIATLFQPSAAIGGDYFDILRLDENRLAVVVADVSGHGLSSGLRMAMIKAALLVLVENAEEPEKILERLDKVVRAEGDSRLFVTATLALLDLDGGELLLLNAGHPPTYWLHDGEAEEILLPGPPLGGLGRSYGKRRLQLLPGDIVVWLSDGLIEAAGGDGEPFGYERIVQVLSEEAASVEQVRDRLLAEVVAHTGGRTPVDDQTMVVLRYKDKPVTESPSAL